MFGVEADDTEESVAVADSVEATSPSNDAGVDLRRGELSVSQHLTNRLD